MNQMWRRVCAAVNPVSTAATSWWCHSAVRHALTGYGRTAQQRQSIRDPGRHATGPALSAGQKKARAELVDQATRVGGER
jgi:hypothetical protein